MTTTMATGPTLMTNKAPIRLIRDFRRSNKTTHTKMKPRNKIWASAQGVSSIKTIPGQNGCPIGLGNKRHKTKRNLYLQQPTLLQWYFVAFERNPPLLQLCKIITAIDWFVITLGVCECTYTSQLQFLILHHSAPKSDPVSSTLSSKDILRLPSGCPNESDNYHQSSSTLTLQLDI